MGSEERSGSACWVSGAPETGAEAPLDQGRGRPMLPREHGRHRRLLKRNGSGRRPGQKQDKAEEKTQSSGSRRIVPCWNQPYDPGRIGKEHERGRSRLHLASLEPPQERCASRDSCYCQPLPQVHGTIQFGLPSYPLAAFRDKMPSWVPAGLSMRLRSLRTGAGRGGRSIARSVRGN